MKTPEWAEQLCATFPKTDSGKPRYRVSWAPDCTECCYGRIVKSYPHIGARWILEVLVPWDKFGPWHEEAFGPKPADGPYCHSHTISLSNDGGKTSEYLSLEDFGADNLRLLITCVERGRMIQRWQIKNHRDELVEREEKAFHQTFSDIWDESVGAGLIGGPLGENITNLNPGKRTSADQRIVVVNELPKNLREKYSCRPGSVKQVG